MRSKQFGLRLAKFVLALWLGLAPLIAAAQVCHESSMVPPPMAVEEGESCGFLVAVTCPPNCEQLLSPLKPQKDGAWLLQTSTQLGLAMRVSGWALPPPRASYPQRTLLEPRQLPSIAVLKCSFLK